MPLIHCHICLTLWSPEKALSMTCMPGSGILHQWITFHPKHSDLSEEAMSDETAALAELEADLQKTADRVSGAALARAELLADLRRRFVLELVRQLVLRHMPITKVQELVESVRNACASTFTQHYFPQSDFEAISADLWRLEDYLVAAASRPGAAPLLPEKPQSAPVLKQSPGLDPTARPFTTIRDWVMDARAALARLDAIVDSPDLF